MRSRVSDRFQIDSSYTCGRAKTMRKRYEWTRIFLKRRKKVAFSNEYGRIRVERAEHALVAGRPIVRAIKMSEED